LESNQVPKKDFKSKKRFKLTFKFIFRSSTFEQTEVADDVLEGDLDGADVHRGRGAQHHRLLSQTVANCFCENFNNDINNILFKK